MDGAESRSRSQLGPPQAKSSLGKRQLGRGICHSFDRFAALLCDGVPACVRSTQPRMCFQAYKLVGGQLSYK